MRENGGKFVKRTGIGDPGKMGVIEARGVFLVIIGEKRVFADEICGGIVHSYRHDDAVEDLAIFVRLLQATCIQQAGNEVCHIRIGERVRRI